MIAGFRHKGLRRFFETGDTRGINVEHRDRILAILTALDVAREIDDVGLPSYRLHQLSGDLKGLWSMTVRANWRIVFRFDGDVHDVDLVDYH